MASADRILYWGSGSTPCWRIQIALAEKELPCEQKLLQFSKKEHKSPEVMAINPRGQLPAFKDGDVVVNESFAAIIYLEESYDSGAQLLPKAPAARAMVWQRIFEVPNLTEAMMKPARLKMPARLETSADPNLLVPALYEKDLEEKSEGLRKELALWEAVLSKSPFLAGDTFTLADVAAAPTFMSLVRFGLSYDKYPTLQKYYNMLKERPSVMSGMPPHWKEDPDKTWLAHV